MFIKPGLVIAGAYKIERVISERGGMSSIYLASKLSDSKMRLVAKFAKTSNSGPTHEDKLLERESELLQQWDWRHPGVVRLFPIERQDNTPVYRLKAIEIADHPYFTLMEYLRGESLGKNMGAIQNYPLEWKLELFYQILQAIAFLHQKGYGHRDLKPDNIVFRVPISPDQIPQPVLIDFALACDDRLGSDIVGKSYTLEYASPERVLRASGMAPQLPLHVRESDIWSLGVILYEILTGSHLFKGSEKTVRTTIIEGTFRDKINNCSSFAPALAAFVKGMVCSDPNQRPKVKEIIYALEEMFPPPRVKSS